MSAVLRWEDPPKSEAAERWYTTRRSKLSPVADALRDQPGRWAVVFEGPHGRATGMATHIRLGQVRCFTPTGDFDATTRRVGATSVVYARYVGEDGAL
jgi:hypothetical protein